MVRPLPQIEDGVPLYDLLCLKSGRPPHVRVSHPDPMAAAPSERAGAVCAAVMQVVRRPTRRHLKELSALVATDDPAAYGDELIRRLRREEIDETRLRSVGHWLATQSVRAGPVSAGICVLGASGMGGSADVVACLGAYPPFTAVTVTAARAGAVDADEFIWRLARNVTGAQRTTCIAALRGTPRRDIKDWVLRKAWSATAPGAEALLAVTVGALHEALDAPVVDDGLINEAAQFLRRLTAPGADPDLTALQNGPAVVMAYLGKIARSRQAGPRGTAGGRRLTIDDFLAVDSIGRFLMAGGEAVRQAWEPSHRADAIGRCSAILSHDAWHGVLTEALPAAQGDAFAVIAAAADGRGIDTFPHRLARLEADPSESSWRDAFDHADLLRARRLAAVAIRALRSVPERPGSDSGTVWAALADILEYLGTHPGIGPEVVTLGLSSRAPHRRSAALRTLQAWGRDAWPEDVTDIVANMAEGDVSSAVRTLAAELADDG